MMSRSNRKEESNPFFDDDDDFGEHTSSSDAQNLTQIKAKINRAETNSVQSLRRTQRVLQETEDVGYKTAEELLHQGEQLNNTEDQLDSINAMTKVSQRHITGLKSVFGSFKNKLFGSKNDSAESPKAEVQHSRLRDTMDEEFGSSGSLNRGGGSGGISSYDSRNKITAARFDNVDVSDDDEWETLRDVSQTSSSSKQAIMDDQMSDISASLHRLKALGRGMNDELRKQDEQLGRLMDKTDQNDMVIKKQNDQMRGLLH